MDAPSRSRIQLDPNTEQHSDVAKLHEKYEESRKHIAKYQRYSRVKAKKGGRLMFEDQDGVGADLEAS